jgi:hypothetical protein
VKISKALFAVVAGMTVAGVASAQDAATTTAEKKAPIQTLLPGAYANAEIRHSTKRSITEDDKVANDIPNLQLRPSLGTTLFDGMVDTSFNWIFIKRPDQVVIDKSTMYNATQWDLVQGKLGHIGPYAEIYPQTDGGYNSLLGFYGELTPSFPVPGGELSTLAYVQPVAEYSSKNYADANQQMTPENKTERDSLSLNDEGTDTIEQRDSTIYNYTGGAVKYKPAAVAGFSVGLGVDFCQTWKPKYETKEVDGDLRTELSGYEATALSINKLTLGYKLTDKLSLSSQLRQNIGGFYGESVTTDRPDRTGNVGNTRWETRVSVIATIL